jgi:dephospho-CoA kinase
LDHKEFPIVIYEAAILFESGNYRFNNNGHCAIRIKNSKGIERDKTTREQVLGE